MRTKEKCILQWKKTYAELYRKLKTLFKQSVHRNRSTDNTIIAIDLQKFRYTRSEQTSLSFSVFFFKRQFLKLVLRIFYISPSVIYRLRL